MRNYFKDKCGIKPLKNSNNARSERSSHCTKGIHRAGHILSYTANQIPRDQFAPQIFPNFWVA